ncbi:MAG: hypothetical protein ACJ74Q_18490 [Pyrinomonadaceae bacterium]
MGDLKKVSDEILHKLEQGELPTGNDAHAHVRPPFDSTMTTRSNSRSTRAFYGSNERRRAVKALVLRYRDEKKLDELLDDELRDEVTNYLQHFDYSRIPTERIDEVYYEAMAHHGQYLLSVSDFLGAWRCIKEREISGHERAARAQKPARPNCSAGFGTGKITRAVPKPDVPMWVDCDEVEAECCYCTPVITNLAVRAADFRQEAGVGRR